MEEEKKADGRTRSLEEEVLLRVLTAPRAEVTPNHPIVRVKCEEAEETWVVSSLIATHGLEPQACGLCRAFSFHLPDTVLTLFLWMVASSEQEY